MDLTNHISIWEGEDSGNLGVDSVIASANDLTNVNGVTQAVGKVGNCASFAAASLQSLSKASNSSLQASGSISIAAWVNMTTLATCVIIAKFSTAAGAGDREYYLAYVHGYGFQFVVRDSGDTTNHGIIHASGVKSTGTWYLVTGVYNAAGPTVTINVNAGTRSSAAGPATPMSSNKLFTIGAWANGGGYFDGLIDQPLLFKRAFSTDEETELYNGGNGLSYAAMQPAGGHPMSKRHGGVPFMRLPGRQW